MMKSQVIQVNNNLSSAIAALEEVERFSLYMGLDHTQAGHMRLLAEEMIAMTTEVLEKCDAKLWMEYQDQACELHLTASAPIEPEAKEEFISVSKAKANAPVKGIKNKISALFAGLLGGCDDTTMYSMMEYGFTGLASPLAMHPGAMMWSMRSYEEAAPKARRDAALEGVEKSIISALSDDVTVSVKSHWVEMVVKKSYKA